MDGSGLILQSDWHVIAATDQPADPGARVDRIENGIVDVYLLLQVQIDCAKIGVRAVEGSPVEATPAAVWNTSGRRICGGGIRKPDDKWLVHLDLDGRDIVVEQAARFGKQVSLVGTGLIAQFREP